MNDGIDQSWSFASPSQAKAAGIKVVSMYLSNEPAKNITAAKVKAYHAVGIGCMCNWESKAGAPLVGSAQGTADATEAVRQVKALISAVGYAPKNKLTIYFSCDQDVNSSQYPTIDAYYKAAGQVVHAAGLRIGVYGEASLVAHLAAAGITDAEWQTIAWSSGVLSPAADFYQTEINKTLFGASVDLDRIIHADQLGAWWPPGHSLDITPTEDTLSAAEVQQIIDEIQSRLPLTRLSKIDTMAYQISEQVVPAVAATRVAVGALGTTAELTAAVLAALPAASAGGLTEADVETALKHVLDGATIQA
jgi:hypothetical protein